MAGLMALRKIMENLPRQTDISARNPWKTKQLS
jgi:hypothetical protein